MLLEVTLVETGRSKSSYLNEDLLPTHICQVATSLPQNCIPPHKAMLRIQDITDVKRFKILSATPHPSHRLNDRHIPPSASAHNSIQPAVYKTPSAPPHSIFFLTTTSKLPNSTDATNNIHLSKAPH